MMDGFEKFAQMRVALLMLEKQLQDLLHIARGEAVAGTPIHAPGPQASPTPAAAKQATTPPKPHPGARAGTKSNPFNDPQGWQGPPVPGAKQLPPSTKEKTPSEIRQMLVHHVEDMRAMAVHMHNCSGLLLAMADVLDTALLASLRKKPIWRR